MGLMDGDKQGGGGLMQGLAGILKRPELYQWLGGVGAGMGRASRGQGYDISGANQQLFGSMQDRQAREKMAGVAAGMDLNIQQRALLNSLPVDMQQQVLAGLAFPEGQDGTSAMQNYAFYRQQEQAAGRTPKSFDEYRLSGRRAGATKIDLRNAPYGFGVPDGAVSPPAPMAPATPTAPPTATPDTTDITPALGGKGWLKGWANVADAFGFGLQYEAAANAKAEIDTLRIDTITSLKSLVDQKMSNQLMDFFEESMVKAGSFSMGPETARLTLGKLRDMLNRRLTILRKQANSPGLDEKSVNDARLDGDTLTALMMRYDNIIAGMGAQSEQPWGDGPPPVDQVFDGPGGEALIWNGEELVPYDG